MTDTEDRGWTALTNSMGMIRQAMPGSEFRGGHDR
jgi:hypothetical protein